MSYSNLDVHVARRKMSLKNSNACLSFVCTVWKGEIVMCCFNNLSKEIVNIFSIILVEADEVETLEKLIREYLYGETINKYYW